MSLRAKLEAVIYAAEEPVTLAQLATLFGPELGAELDAAEAAAKVLSSSATSEASDAQSADPESASVKGTASPEPDPHVAEYNPVTADAAGLVQSSDMQASSAEAIPAQPLSEELVAAPDEAVTTAPPDPVRSARQREREIRDRLRMILDELVAEYAGSDRGMEIREVAGGYRMSTKPEYHDAVRGFVKILKPPMKLSLQALETLAVVAYKQPVTAPEISDIRGVESAGTLGSLIARKLVTTAGRKQVIGRPILYKTTKEFLLRFGLRDINELPSMEEFEKMAGALGDDLVGPDEATNPAETGPRQNLAELAFPEGNGREESESALSGSPEEAETPTPVEAESQL